MFSIPQPDGRPAIAGVYADAIPVHVQQRLETVQQLLEAECIAEALAAVTPHRKTHCLLENAFGVCQLRRGDLPAALAVFNELAAHGPGRRNELPIVIRVNLATTLVLHGEVAAGVEILHDLRGTSHPALSRLSTALRAWEAQMTESQGKMWRFFQIPPRRPVLLEPFPGDLL